MLCQECSHDGQQDLMEVSVAGLWGLWVMQHTHTELHDQMSLVLVYIWTSSCPLCVHWFHLTAKRNQLSDLIISTACSQLISLKDWNLTSHLHRFVLIISRRGLSAAARGEGSSRVTTNVPSDTSPSPKSRSWCQTHGQISIQSLGVRLRVWHVGRNNQDHSRVKISGAERD